LHRELQELKDDRTRHSNRIKGLLASQGLDLEVMDELLPEWLEATRLWDGSALGADLQLRLLREYERWQLAHRQVLDLHIERRRRILCDDTAHVELVRRLLGLAGIGANGAWLLVYEFFAWRKLQNRKQAGALVGLTGTPYHSGGSEHEQGISKAGSKRMRRMLVELAWCWLRWQPESSLSQWYARRFGTGKGAARKIGIVAVARKLVIALWKYLERGEIPAGAKLVDWRSKLIRAKVNKPAA
jgi:transposase